MMLVNSDVRITPDALVPLVYVPDRKGSFQVEMIGAARSFGRLAYPLAPQLHAVLSEVSAGNPVLVLQNLGLSWYPRWHFAVVKGFDLKRDKIVLNSGTLENYEVALSTFERTWARSNYWSMVTPTPGKLPATAEAEAYYIAVAGLEETHPEAAITRAYQSGLEQWPADRNLLMGYGNLLYRQGEYAIAAQQFGSVIQHHSDYAPAWNNLAEILLLSGDIAQARTHAQQAVSLGGSFIDIYRATLSKIDRLDRR
jgi:tetratricopeptide (TPR) repeat protein